MKTRDSGMPPREAWAQFFNIDQIFTALGIDRSIAVLVDYGTGYGTFAIPAAQRGISRAIACDIEATLITDLALDARRLGLHNLDAQHRDLIVDGTGLPDASVDFIMLFNILLRIPSESCARLIAFCI